MSITFQATMIDGVLRPDNPVDVPDRTRVQVTVEPINADDPWLSHPMNSVIGIGSGPTDSAAQHDHYIYGTPKK